MRYLNKAPFRSVFLFALVVSATTMYRAHALVPMPEIPKFKVDPKVMSCMVVSANINKKISSFSEARSKHQEEYTRLIDRITQMIEKWKGWGYDTDKVEEGLDKLKDKVEEYKQDVGALGTKLEEVKSACGEDNYETKISEAKLALKKVREDVVDIRVFYQTELRKDIRALRDRVLE